MNEQCLISLMSCSHSNEPCPSLDEQCYMSSVSCLQSYDSCMLLDRQCSMSSMSFLLLELPRSSPDRQCWMSMVLFLLELFSTVSEMQPRVLVSQTWRNTFNGRWPDRKPDVKAQLAFRTFSVFSVTCTAYLPHAIDSRTSQPTCSGHSVGPLSAISYKRSPSECAYNYQIPS